MASLNTALSFNTLLDLIQPGHMVIVFFVVLISSLIMSLVLLFHFNKYRQHSLGTILAELVYIAGVVILFILAIIFLALFSK